MFNKNKKTQITKGLSYWFLILSILILSGTTAWTAYVGQSAIDFSRDQSLGHIQKPVFKEYLTELGIQPIDQSVPATSAELPKTIPLGNPIAAANDRKKQDERAMVGRAGQATPLVSEDQALKNEEVAAEVSLLKIFGDLRVFENRRAEIAFKKIETVVAKVQKGSVADDWGFKKGDHIKMVANVPVLSLWDFYQLVEETPKEQLNFMIARGKKQVKVVPAEQSEKVLANQIGLLFVIPTGLSYMSKVEASELANQFDERFVRVIGADFKKEYVASLDSFGTKLAALPLLKEADLLKYEKVNASAMLVWHHEKFLLAIEKFQTDMRARVMQQAAAMAAFQQTIFGFAAAFILCVVAFVIRSRVLAKQVMES